MDSRIKTVAFDFIFGGIIVAGALLMASLLGPLYGGLIAGAPIRAGGTIFLAGLHRGEEFATQVARGAVLAMIANVGFAMALYLCLPKFGLYRAFLVASIIFISLAATMTKMSS